MTIGSQVMSPAAEGVVRNVRGADHAAALCGFGGARGVLCWLDCVEDDQLPAATWAWQREGAWRLIGIVGVLMIWRFCPKQQPDPCDIGCTVAVSEKAIVTDAVLASEQNVDQEPADEL